MSLLLGKRRRKTGRIWSDISVTLSLLIFISATFVTASVAQYLRNKDDVLDDKACRIKKFNDLGDEASKLTAQDILNAKPAIFTPEFVWGAATSAYQIEGAVNEGGRGPSIWDTFSHNPGNIAGDQTGDVACDHYNHVDEDIALMKEIGISHYRFSISWSRIMPTGVKPVNDEGLNFYKSLVDKLKKEGIEPAVTLYHWDLPQALQDKGGWMNADTVQAFADYSDVVFAALGAQVKMWFTLNEPWSTSILGHGLGLHAPGIKNLSNGVYTVAHNQLLAHSAAAKVYREQYKEKQKGQVGIVLSTQFKEPLCDASPTDVEAAERNLQFYLGWFASPIFKGDYPEVMRERVGGDRLPTFTAAQKEELKGSVDFLGLNTYSSSLVTSKVVAKTGDYFSDLGTSSTADPSWVRAQSSWLYVAPTGMRKLLRWIKKEYDNPVVYVTENGVDVPDESSWQGQDAFNDDFRVDYLQNYIAEVGKAIKYDKVDVRGYFVWSLLDNFEWAEGYNSRFGLVRVNFDTQERTLKKSARVYSNLVKGYRGT